MDGTSQGSQLLNRLFTDVWLAYLFSRLSKISFFETTHLFEILEKQLKGWSLAGQTWKTERFHANLGSSMPYAPRRKNVAENSGVILASFPELEFAVVTATEQALGLDLLKVGHSGLPVFELIMSHNMNSCFAGLGAFTNLTYLSVPSFCAEFEDDVVPLSHHAPSFDFPRLQLLVIESVQFGYNQYSSVKVGYCRQRKTVRARRSSSTALHGSREKRGCPGYP
jgi:hypothetical protein